MISIEKMTQAFELLYDNVQAIVDRQSLPIYEAVIHQNKGFLGEIKVDEGLTQRNQALKSLDLNQATFRGAYQALLLKIGQTRPLQSNHQLTPDSIGYLLGFMIEHLRNSGQISIYEPGLGMGNLAHTLLAQLPGQVQYSGVELDDLLIELAQTTAQVLGFDVHYQQLDAVGPQTISPVDFVVSDLPIGYYPDDQLASRFDLASKDGHTYAHHLIMAQSMRYLKVDGYAIFLAPYDLMTSPQADLLKSWISKQAQLCAVITLPENLFKTNPKAIYILQTKQSSANPVFVHPIKDMSNPTEIQRFMQAFKMHLP